MATEHHDELETAIAEVEAARDLHAAAARRLLEAVARRMISGGATESEVASALATIAGVAMRPDLAASPAAHIAELRTRLN